MTAIRRRLEAERLEDEISSAFKLKKLNYFKQNCNNNLLIIIFYNSKIVNCLKLGVLNLIFQFYFQDSFSNLYVSYSYYTGIKHNNESVMTQKSNTNKQLQNL